MLQAPYPLQYGLTRSYARASLAELENRPRSQLKPASAQDVACGHLLPWMRERGWPLSAVSAFSQEAQGVLAWLDWALNGKKLVTVLPALTQAFERSDCGDMRISDVLDSASFTLYLHFEGPLAQRISYFPQSTFEGAFIVSRPDTALRVVLCSKAPPDTPLTERWKERYDLRIAREHFDLPADTAIDLALADDLRDLQMAHDTLQARGSTAEAQQAAALCTRMREGHPAYCQALRLVLNALAFLKAYPQLQAPAWTEGAPPRLVNQALTGSDTERRRATSKLWALGHIPVQRIGQEFAKPAAESTAHLNAHWRRGHWRHQPHGPAFSLRKLIWIQPMLVGADTLSA